MKNVYRGDLVHSGYIEEGRLRSEDLIIERRLEFLSELAHATTARLTAHQVEDQGFSVCEGLLSQEVVELFIDALARVDKAESIRQRGSVFAVRNLLDVCPEVCTLAESSLVRHYVEPILGSSFIPVRGILFDKIPNANWKVPWHQDVTIAVKERSRPMVSDLGR